MDRTTLIHILSPLIFAILLTASCSRVDSLWHNKIKENKLPADRPCILYEDEQEDWDLEPYGVQEEV